MTTTNQINTGPNQINTGPNKVNPNYQNMLFFWALRVQMRGFFGGRAQRLQNMCASMKDQKPVLNGFGPLG